MKVHVLEGKNIAEDFNDWMVKIGNKHLPNNESMSNAFEIIEKHEKV